MLEQIEHILTECLDDGMDPSELRCPHELPEGWKMPVVTYLDVRLLFCPECMAMVKQEFLSLNACLGVFHPAPVHVRSGERPCSDARS